MKSMDLLIHLNSSAFNRTMKVCFAAIAIASFLGRGDFRGLASANDINERQAEYLLRGNYREKIAKVKTMSMATSYWERVDDATNLERKMELLKGGKAIKTPEVPVRGSTQIDKVVDLKVTDKPKVIKEAASTVAMDLSPMLVKGGISPSKDQNLPLSPVTVDHKVSQLHAAQSESEAPPKDTDKYPLTTKPLRKLDLCTICTDEETPWMLKTVKDCPSTQLLDSKCNKNNMWKSYKFCRHSCYFSGYGYNNDYCCSTTIQCTACTNNETPWMTKNGKTCTGFSHLATKCRNNLWWTKNKFCQHSCFHERNGNGYEGDNCCDTTDFPSTPPSPRPSSTTFSMPSKMTPLEPSHIPSNEYLSSFPTSLPSDLPSSSPMTTPSSQPSESLSITPSSYMSAIPSTVPSQIPSTTLSSSPTSLPSDLPSSSSSNHPSTVLSSPPSGNPSTLPTDIPSDSPISGECPPGFSDPGCSTFLGCSDPRGSICLNGGSCNDDNEVQYFNCHCPEGYFGVRCESTTPKSDWMRGGGALGTVSMVGYSSRIHIINSMLTSHTMWMD